MQRLTLRFADRALERAFFEDHLPRALPQIRVAYTIAAVLTVAGSAPASAMARNGWPLIFSAAVGMICLLVVWATWTPAFSRLKAPILAAPFVAFAPCFTAILALQLMRPVIVSVLFAEVFALTFAFVFSRIGFVGANVVAWLMLASTLPTAIALSGDLAGEVTLYAFHVFNFYVTVALVGYFVERYIRRDFVQRRALDAERARAEGLLLNILPRSIAARLEAGEEPIADGYADVTVLFADIVDFTGISAKVSPDEMVQMLNGVFSAFDALAAEHGLEKIKTVGDAYMVVGGLPDPRPRHAEAVAEMALGVQRVVAGMVTPTGGSLRVRIGINTGPVVAGVIGTAKFAYDLWGDAVNTASRMESQGVPDAIQVTEATYERLKDRYAFEKRGVIDVKGKGLMPAYLLLSRKGSPSAEAASDATEATSA